MNHNLLDVIVNGDLEEETAPTSGETSAPLAPKTFHNVADAKSLLGDGNQSSLDKAYDTFPETDKSIGVFMCFHYPKERYQLGKWLCMTVKVKKFIQRTGRNTDFKEKRPISLDKSKIECYNCHRKGHFARECRSRRNQGRRSYGDNGRSNAPTTESSSQALVAQDGLGGYDWSNDFEVEPVNYALMAISSSSSSSSSDSEREKHNKAKLEIRGYEIALESLESRIIGHEKNELAWGEKYEFQNYELKCREIKINNLNLELEKVVKERDELKDKIAKWEESSKNLDEILNSQMSARDKTSLGYNTQLNELSSNHETDSENSLRNFLTPRADILFAGLDKYAIGNKIIESQITELNTKTSETTDDEEEGYEMQTVRPETQIVKTRDDKSGQTSKKQGIDFNKLTRTGFVSTARPSISTARPSISTARHVCTARLSVSTARLVCTARPSVSTARPVYATRPIYPRMDNVRPRGSCSPIKRSYYTKPAFRPKDLKQDVKTFGVQNMTTAGTRAVVNTGKGKLDTDLKKSRWVWRPKGNYLDHVSKDSGSFMLKKGNPEIMLQDHAVVDSGCSSHMTSNKAYLSDYEDFNGGFVAFGSDPKGGLENQLNHNVKIIRCDNGTEFKNYAMNEFCAKKGIKREFSVAKTPQQNGVAERKNRTLIEAARTMLADSLLHIPFWAEAVNTACYVLNRVLVTKPQNKTPYELLIGKSPSISFMRPFGCPLTILNTLDSLGKFDGKSDEGYLLGYSTSSKAFRVYNKRTKRVEENLHINFLEDQPNVAGTGPNWMFDLDFLTNSMNYIPVSVENQVIVDAGTQDSYVAGSSGKDKGPTQEYILLPLQPHRTRFPVKDVVQDAQAQPYENASLDKELVVNAMNDESRQAFKEENRRIASQKKAAQATSTNQLSIDRPFVSTGRSFVSTDRSNTLNVSAASI
ncbi:retrovirus-related pol polyprotein from transposon TNT 1-94 [Tanacetum coccineum]|uniref:Retrovirus-related pol polyprotein from transposon TNT 1-94 n=1 Tax=Tanacetum coccineum TaxID=301880 RepID=A0ABQ5DN61_9ASTR